MPFLCMSSLVDPKLNINGGPLAKSNFFHSLTKALFSIYFPWLCCTGCEFDALALSTSFCLSAFFLSMISTALFTACFSRSLFRLQYSYAVHEPKQKVPTAQLHALKIGPSLY